MAANPIPKMTAAENLAMERASRFKSEFEGGEVFAMPGGCRRAPYFLDRRCGNWETRWKKGREL